jgi:hypothetical protein
MKMNAYEYNSFWSPVCEHDSMKEVYLKVRWRHWIDIESYSSVLSAVQMTS